VLEERVVRHDRRRTAAPFLAGRTVMERPYEPPRIDTAARIIPASPQAVYRTLMDPRAISLWRAPRGTKGNVNAFELRAGGRFRISFAPELRLRAVNRLPNYFEVLQGEFLELVPNGRVISLIELQSSDPACAGTIRATATLSEVWGGTLIEVECENVPDGIRRIDHQAIMSDRLSGLSLFVH
jgi:uncharacterized protein YndB with AHSA1/START domain